MKVFFYTLGCKVNQYETQAMRRLMEEEGLSYEQLGERLGMNPQTLNRYVLGQREPKIGTASAMAAATDGGF